MPHQPTHNAIPDRDGNAQEGTAQQQGLQVPPLDARPREAAPVGLLVVRGLVQVRDVLEVEVRFFAEAVLAVHDHGPEDFAEGL